MISDACDKIITNPSKIDLIAVSKTQSSEVIKLAYECGQFEFGENYVQESTGKQINLKDLSIHWHFIGHLQKNKVKSVVGTFKLIHSVNDFELAQKISQKAAELKIEQSILLEINLANEVSKSGFTKESIDEIFIKIMDLPNLCLEGLMAIPPLSENAEDSRPYFKKLSQIFEKLKIQLPESKKLQWKRLSMGTTQDFVVAIEEGANCVRVGTAIFGKRINNENNALLQRTET